MPGIWDSSRSIQGCWLRSDGMAVVNGILEVGCMGW